MLLFLFPQFIKHFETLKDRTVPYLLFFPSLTLYFKSSNICMLVILWVSVREGSSFQLRFFLHKPNLVLFCNLAVTPAQVLWPTVSLIISFMKGDIESVIYTVQKPSSRQQWNWSFLPSFGMFYVGLWRKWFGLCLHHARYNRKLRVFAKQLVSFFFWIHIERNYCHW